jgi:hypothetical protein
MRPVLFCLAGALALAEPVQASSTPDSLEAPTLLTPEGPEPEPSAPPMLPPPLLPADAPPEPPASKAPRGVEGQPTGDGTSPAAGLQTPPEKGPLVPEPPARPGTAAAPPGGLPSRRIGPKDRAQPPARSERAQSSAASPGPGAPRGQPAPRPRGPQHASAPPAEASRRAPPEETSADDGPPRLALKWAPFARSVTSVFDEPAGLNAGSVGLEYRLGRYLALRTDLQYSGQGALWDFVGLKLSLFADSLLRPFASAGFSGIRIVEGSAPAATRLGMVAGVGLNLFFGRHVFLEVEGKYRRYSEEPLQLAEARNLSSWTLLAGAGVAFF